MHSSNVTPSPGELTVYSSVETVKSVIREAVRPAWPSGWAKWPNTKEAFRQLALEKMTAIVKPDRCGHGRGIVTAGGGSKYFPSVWVLLKRLRQLECKLPVEVWHLGPIEMDPAMQRLLEALGARVVDATSWEQPFRRLNGWELKVFSTVHSEFEEALFIDADCVPVCDPEYLFDHPDYVKTGSTFWPDFAPWTLSADVWDTFGIIRPENVVPHVPADTVSQTFEQPISPNFEPPIESGQYLINKSKCYKELQLALWYCQYSDFTFEHVFGDKETFHLAWRKYATPYSMPKVWPGWAKHTILQFDLDGQLTFLHRTQDKWRLPCNNVRCLEVPGEAELFDLADDLETRWSGRAWENRHPTDVERMAMQRLENRMYRYVRVGHDERVIELMRNRRVGVGSGACERRWSIFAKGDHLQLALTGDAGPTAILSTSGDGSWSGKWLVHEQMPVRLVPHIDNQASQQARTASNEPARLNLGCGLNALEGFINHDLAAHSPHVDVVWNLDHHPWPFRSNHFEQVCALDVVEHLGDVVGFMNQAWQILRSDGTLHVRVPRFDHFTAWTDPTHKRGFTSQSFEYFTNTGYGLTIPFYTMRRWEQIAVEELDGNLSFILRPIKSE